MRRGLMLMVMAALGAAVVVGVAASAALKKPPHSRQALTQHLAASRQARLLSPPARAALTMLATGQRTFRAPSVATAARPAHGQLQLPAAGLANVRVNDPAQDGQVDQTTQDDPSIAVAGKNVVVGYTDSQHVLPSAFTAGFDLNGYSYSQDGGASFKDGGAVPNPPGRQNVGDPWLASDRKGAFYYSSLAFDELDYRVDVAVSKSTDGGKTWSSQSIVSPTDGYLYFADKEAVGVGPDPTDTAHDIVYATWDDFSVDDDYDATSGLAVARSTDGGQHWELNYADQSQSDYDSCSFTQYVGAVPAIAPNGTLYVAAEKASVDDPDCTGENPLLISEVVFTSNDGGQTFDNGAELGQVVQVGGLVFGPGRAMGDLELPSIAVGPDGKVAVAWNDAGFTDTEPLTSNIRLATSDDGENWNVDWLTSGTSDSFQPAISADAKGLHVLYYARTSNDRIDAVLANSAGASWTTKRVSSASFSAALTVPNFDPVISDGYMGQYISIVSAGGRTYLAWADNRDTVKNFMYQSGRADPNVYLARQ